MKDFKNYLLVEHPESDCCFVMTKEEWLSNKDGNLQEISQHDTLQEANNAGCAKQIEGMLTFETVK